MVVLYSVNPHSITMLMATLLSRSRTHFPVLRAWHRGVDFLPHTFRSGLWPRREYVWKILATLDHTLRRGALAAHTHSDVTTLRFRMAYHASFSSRLLSPCGAKKWQSPLRKSSWKDKGACFLIRRPGCGGEKCEKFHGGASTLTNCSARGEISS